MERHAFAMKVKEGKMNDYRKKLGEIWPELLHILTATESIISASGMLQTDLRILRKCRRSSDFCRRRESENSSHRENPEYFHMDLHTRSGYAPDVS